MIQDKMIIMVWEEATAYDYPVIVKDASGSEVVVENLFEADYLNKWIWTHFVPVIVNESYYGQFYEDIEGKRTIRYMDKFNDDSFKVMDVNGNILNTTPSYEEILNLSNFIDKYYIKTTFLKSELINYSNEKSFRTAYYLATKYIDAAIYLNKSVRSEVIELSNIYLKEAKAFLVFGQMDKKLELQEKIHLLEIYQNLVLNKPKKVLRQLNRIDLNLLYTSNEPMLAFLYETTYRVLKDEKNASVWRSKVSLVNLKKANDIIKNAD
ncbi:hypothetical protein [Psychroserpens sp. MEBiC05023]